MMAMRVCKIGLAALLLYALPGWAQFEGRLDAVIIKGDKLSAYGGQELKYIKVFRYDAKQHAWRIIPSQIDDCDERYYYPSHEVTPKNLTARDELLFMARDAGDFASVNEWIPYPGSHDLPRYQIELTDSIGQRRYLYAYFVPDEGVQEDPTDYMRYRPVVGSAPDSVISKYYILSYNPEGLWYSISIPVAENGNDQNFFDRLKIRMQADVSTPMGTFNDNLLTEDSFKKNGESRYIDGKIRLIKTWELKINVKIKLPFGGSATIEQSISPLALKYYPYYNEFSFPVPTSFSGDQIKVKQVDMLRVSTDLQPKTAVMRMYANNDLWQHPDGVAVDRVNDAVSTNLNMAAWNWWLQAGNGGSLLSVSYLQPILGVTPSLYYWDNPTGTNDTGGTKLDTGDMTSWGDTGIKYGAMTPQDGGGNINMAFRFYFLGRNISPDSAYALKSQTAYPLNVVVREQGTVVPVELTALSAFTKQNTIHLAWATASETNNLGFEVERKDATATDWQTIAFVKGNGTVVSRRDYVYEDADLSLGSYHYRLKQIDTDGAFTYSTVLEAEVAAPKEMSLAQNYPNPFNPTTTIDYRIAQNSGETVTLSIFDMLGRTVRTLVNEPAQPGYYRILWDGRDDSGRMTGSGVYFYLLSDGRSRILHKMIKVQ